MSRAAVLLTAGLLALWVFGVWWYGGLAALPTVAIYSGAGYLRIVWDQPWSIVPDVREWHSSFGHSLPFGWRFSIEGMTFSNGITRTALDIPLWILILASGIATWFLGRAARPRLAGSCSHCRYDRSGLPSSAPCPECGKTPV